MGNSVRKMVRPAVRRYASIFISISTCHATGAGFQVALGVFRSGFRCVVRDHHTDYDFTKAHMFLWSVTLYTSGGKFGQRRKTVLELFLVLLRRKRLTFWTRIRLVQGTGSSTRTFNIC